MNKNTWIATMVLGLAWATPSAAHAHGQYLQGVSDFVSNEVAMPACALPGMTCGLCHQPLAGDPLADIGVPFDGIETTIRSRSFYEGLTGDGGWMHSAHMAGTRHIDSNRMMLLDTALPALLANGYDGDGDGVPDLEELSLGYNPLLAYDEGDPTASQLCDTAGRFPSVGATSGSTGGDETTSGGSTSNDTTGTPDPDTSGGVDTGSTTTPSVDEAGSSDSSGNGSNGGSGSTGDSGAADGGGDESGCGCRSTGQSGGLLGLMMMVGLGAARRRRGRSAR